MRYNVVAKRYDEWGRGWGSGYNFSADGAYVGIYPGKTVVVVDVGGKEV